jgi:hypothetical protein
MSSVRDQIIETGRRIERLKLQVLQQIGFLDCLQRNCRGVKRARLAADLLKLPFKLASPTLEQLRPGPL